MSSGKEKKFRNVPSVKVLRKLYSYYCVHKNKTTIVTLSRKEYAMFKSYDLCCLEGELREGEKSWGLVGVFELNEGSFQAVYLTEEGFDQICMNLLWWKPCWLRACGSVKVRSKNWWKNLSLVKKASWISVLVFLGSLVVSRIDVGWNVVVDIALKLLS